MDQIEEMQTIDQDIIRARRLEGWMLLGVYLVMVTALYWLIARFGWPVWLLWLAIGWTVVSLPFEIIILPQWKYRSWRYRISDQEIELHHGIVVRKRTIIPMARIQHIDATQGPILKQYGLSTVTFSTAAGSHQIPALKDSKAEDVRKRIAALARIADDAI